MYAKKYLDDIATVYGVEVLENEHKINELERELLTTSKQNLRAQIAITEKIEKIEWITKEKVCILVKWPQILNILKRGSLSGSKLEKIIIQDIN